MNTQFMAQCIAENNSFFNLTRKETNPINHRIEYYVHVRPEFSHLNRANEDTNKKPNTLELNNTLIMRPNSF